MKKTKLTNQHEWSDELEDALIHLGNVLYILNDALDFCDLNESEQMTRDAAKRFWYEHYESKFLA